MRIFHTFDIGESQQPLRTPHIAFRHAVISLDFSLRRIRSPMLFEIKLPSVDGEILFLHLFCKRGEELSRGREFDLRHSVDTAHSLYHIDMIFTGTRSSVAYTVRHERDV